MPVTIDLLENVMFREAYERAVEKGLLEGIEKGFERGIEKGFEQGIEQGIERGIEQGIERGIEKGVEKGLEQGIEQGLEKGAEQARRDILVRLFERRFGPLSPVNLDRVTHASTVELSRWTDQLLDAASAEAVFA